MSTVLVLNSSVTGGNSVSRALVEDVVANLRAADPSLTVVHRDLAAQPVPHISAETLAGFGPDVSGKTLSDDLIAELQAADTVVIGAPMYNFGIASSLKAWFDHVLRAGVTFRYGAAGPEGLVTGKRVIVVETRGGLYSEGPTVSFDSQEPHLRTMLGFIGLTDVTFVRAERLAFGAEIRDAAIAEARTAVGRVGEALRAA